MAEVKTRAKEEKYKNDPARGLSTAFDITPGWYVVFFYSDQFAAYSHFISWAGQYPLV